MILTVSLCFARFGPQMVLWEWQQMHLFGALLFIYWKTRQVSVRYQDIGKTNFLHFELEIYDLDSSSRF